MKCTNCGAPNARGAVTCYNCKEALPLRKNNRALWRHIAQITGTIFLVIIVVAFVGVSIERHNTVAKQEETINASKPAVDKAKEMSLRLDIGLNYSEYCNLLGDVRVEMEKVPIEYHSHMAYQSLDLAMSKYMDAKYVWQRSIDTPGEDPDLNGRLSDIWSKASDQVDLASSELSN